MPRSGCAKLFRVVVAGAALWGVVSCGGKAASEQQSSAGGGAAGAAFSAGAAGAAFSGGAAGVTFSGGAAGVTFSGGVAGVDVPAPAQPQPSVVSMTGDDGASDRQAKAQCVRGFQGFSAQLGGIRFELMAFVFEPGDYEGDPVRALWLDALQAGGEHYRAVVGLAPSSGSISLHVDQIDVRFRGSLEAELPVLDDPTLPPLKVALTFDIDPRAGCP